MAYNVAANLRPTRPGQAFLEARDNAVKNALVERQMANQEQAQQFQQQRLTAADQTAASERSRVNEQDDHKTVYLMLNALNAASGDPSKFSALADRIAAHPVMQKAGVTRDELTPEEVAQTLPLFAAQAGQAPTKQYEKVEGPRGAVLQRDPTTGELKQVVGPDNSQQVQPNAGAYRLLTAPELAAKGFPAGTVAQVGPDGKIDIVTKRDNTGALSQKDSTTAKMKLNTVALARQQLAKIRDAFEEGRKGVNAFGPGQGLLPTQAGKKFDARVNQMRSTLTALTRVPGVGSMSDYETKLDQSKFPSRTSYESVTEDQLNNLDDQLSLIANGYQTLLSGSQPEAQPAAPPPAQAAPVATAPVRVNTPQEAAALPSGTHFVTPDGRMKVRP